MAPLGWGVIGIGGIVTGTIAPAMQAEPDCELVAGVSRDPARAAAFAQTFGARRAYTDYQDLLADPEVEAVLIATPNAFHAEQVAEAAAAGKHVLCEKPLATNAADAARAVEACARAGVKLGINFHNRQVPWVRDTAALIGTGAIGEVIAAQVHVGSGPRHYDNWRADPAIAGLGTVHNVGVHALDFLRVILHDEPVEVSALFRPPPSSGQVEMLALISLRFDHGALAFCNCNETLPYPLNSIEIYGTKGRVFGTRLTRARSGGTLTLLNEAGESERHYPAVEAHRLTLAAFTRAVLEDLEPDPSGLDGLRSAQLCEAIARAASQGVTAAVEYGSG